MSSGSIAYNIEENIKHKRLIWDLVKRDFKTRYIGSALGSYWNFIHPLAMVFIYTVVFSKVMKLKFPALSDSSFGYTIFLCSGLLPWTSFQDMVLRGCNQYHEYAGFIKKVSFPKEIVHTITMGSSAITFLISMLIYFAMLLFVGHKITASILIVPWIMLMQLLFASGLGLIFGVLNVFLKDTQQILNIVFQVWFWTTPILYSVDQLPNYVKNILILNPLFHFVTIYQTVFVKGGFPSIASLLGVSIFSVLIYFLGTAILHSFRFQISDEL